MLSVYPSKSNLSSLKTCFLFLYVKITSSKIAYLCNLITRNEMQKNLSYKIGEKKNGKE